MHYIITIECQKMSIDLIIHFNVRCMRFRDLDQEGSVSRADHGSCHAGAALQREHQACVQIYQVSPRPEYVRCCFSYEAIVR